MRSNSLLPGSVATIGLIAFASASWATGSSSAYDASATVTINGATATLAPINPVSGTAPPSYSDSNTVFNVTNTQTLGIYSLSVGAQTLVSSATSSFPTPPSATATATIQNLTAALDETVGGVVIPLISLNAQTISSTSTAGGGPAVGSTTIQTVTITENPIFGPLGTETLSIPSTIPPNDVVFDVDGAKLVINAQTAIPGGISTNAVELFLTDASYNGSTPVSGDVILSHSQASVTGTVPEPATWAMMLVGVGMLGGVIRRRDRGIGSAI